MTNKDINLAYNRYRGVHGYTGEISSLAAITHVFLLDASYDVYNKRIKTLPLRHKAKVLSENMHRCYNQFFRKFFAPFNEEERAFILDKCDAMLEHISHGVEISRLAMMDCCNSEDVDRQAKIADLWLCNRFASEAQSFYRRTWKKAGFKLRGVLFTKDDIDKDIDGILKYSLALAIELYGEGEDVSPKHHKKLQDTVASLTRRICEFINQDYYATEKADRDGK